MVKRLLKRETSLQPYATQGSLSRQRGKLREKFGFHIRNGENKPETYVSPSSVRVLSKFSSCSDSSEICACSSLALEIVQSSTISDKLSTVMDEEPYAESRRSSALENLSLGPLKSVLGSRGSSDFRMERYESIPESVRFSSSKSYFLDSLLAMVMMVAAAFLSLPLPPIPLYRLLARLVAARCSVMWPDSEDSPLTPEETTAPLWNQRNEPPRFMPLTENTVPHSNRPSSSRFLSIKDF